MDISRTFARSAAAAALQSSTQSPCSEAELAVSRAVPVSNQTTEVARRSHSHACSSCTGRPPGSSTPTEFTAEAIAAFGCWLIRLCWRALRLRAGGGWLKSAGDLLLEPELLAEPCRVRSLQRGARRNEASTKTAQRKAWVGKWWPACPLPNSCASTTQDVRAAPRRCARASDGPAPGWELHRRQLPGREWELGTASGWTVSRSPSRCRVDWVVGSDIRGHDSMWIAAACEERGSSAFLELFLALPCLDTARRRALR